MAKQKLPKTLSAGILLALKDLTWVERNKSKYKINMDTWHTPVDPHGNALNEIYCDDDTVQAKCEVCFAGSVMAGTLGIEDTNHSEPGFFDSKTANKLYALDYVRNGMVSEAVNEWYSYDVPALKGVKGNNDIVKITLAESVDVPDYELDRAGWKRAMRKLAAELAEIGL